MTMWWPPVASSCMGNPHPARVKPVVTKGEEIAENITRGPANERPDGERSGKTQAIRCQSHGRDARLRASQANFPRVVPALSGCRCDEWRRAPRARTNNFKRCDPGRRQHHIFAEEARADAANDDEAVLRWIDSSEASACSISPPSRFCRRFQRLSCNDAPTAVSRAARLEGAILAAVSDEKVAPWMCSA